MATLILPQVSKPLFTNKIKFAILKNQRRERKPEEYFILAENDEFKNLCKQLKHLYKLIDFFIDKDKDIDMFNRLMNKSLHLSWHEFSS